MQENILHLGVILNVSLLAAITSQVINRIIEVVLHKNAALLEDPSKLFKSSFKRQVGITVLMVSLFWLSCLKAGTIHELLISWLLISFLILISSIDLEHQLIFDDVLCVFAICSLLLTVYLPTGLLDRLAAAFLGGGIMLLLAIITRGGIGGGDIKLIFVLGLWQGIHNLIFILIVGFISGGIVSLLLLVCGFKNFKDSIAYGPYFALGAILICIGIV